MNEPIMIFDKEQGKYMPLNIFITRVIAHFEGSETTIEFDMDLDRYSTKLKFSLAVAPKLSLTKEEK